GGRRPVRRPRLPPASEQAEPEGRRRMSEPKGRGAAWTEEPSREPKGRGAAWTEERGTSDEGRRRLKAPRRRARGQRTSDEGPPPQAARPARRRLKAPRRRARGQRTSDEGPPPQAARPAR